LPFLSSVIEKSKLEIILFLAHIKTMNADELKQLLRGSAFRPFTVHAEGADFLISHPEFAALSPRGDTLIIFHKDDSAFDILDVSLIARTAVHGKNGSAS
jgi:hypothetical protein